MSAEPRWLTLELVLGIHTLSIERFGGTHGVRDEGLLASGIARAPNRFAYAPDTSMFQLAAAYAFGIARNHPFLDGNKRTAVASAVTFLGLNDWSFTGTEAEVVVATLALAAGDWDEATYAYWLEQNCSPA